MGTQCRHGVSLFPWMARSTGTKKGSHSIKDETALSERDGLTSTLNRGNEAAFKVQSVIALSNRGRHRKNRQIHGDDDEPDCHAQKHHHHGL